MKMKKIEHEKKSENRKHGKSRKIKKNLDCKILINTPKWCIYWYLTSFGHKPMFIPAKM